MKKTPLDSTNCHAAEIRLLNEMPMCPLTNGLPTKMVRESFERECLRCQAEMVAASGPAANTPRHTFCQICEGKKRPKELKFFSKKELKSLGARHKSRAKQAGGLRVSQGKLNSMRMHQVFHRGRVEVRI